MTADNFEQEPEYEEGEEIIDNEGEPMQEDDDQAEFKDDSVQGFFEHKGKEY